MASDRDVRHRLNDREQRFVKEGGYVERCIEGETVLVPVRSGTADLDCIVAFNQTASHIWQQLDGERTVAELVSALRDEYEVESEVAERDVVEFLESMEKAGLVRRV